MERITSNPSVANGEPCIRDTGISVKQIANLLKTTKPYEVLQSYPKLTLEDIDAVLAYNGKPVAIQTPMYGIDVIQAALKADSKIPVQEFLQKYYSKEEEVVVEKPKEVVKEEEPNAQNLPTQKKEVKIKEEPKAATKPAPKKAAVKKAAKK